MDILAVTQSTNCAILVIRPISIDGFYSDVINSEKSK